MEGAEGAATGAALEGAALKGAALEGELLGVARGELKGTFHNKRDIIGRCFNKKYV